MAAHIYCVGHLYRPRSRDGAAVDAAPKKGLGCVVANNGWFTAFRSGLSLLCSRFRQCSGAPSRSLGIPVQNQRYVASRGRDRRSRVVRLGAEEHSAPQRVSLRRIFLAHPEYATFLNRLRARWVPCGVRHDSRCMWNYEGPRPALIATASDKWSYTLLVPSM